MDAISIKNVTKRYKDFTLDNISIRLPKGTIMGFIGENGAGKSTTINLIMDLVKKDSGQITVLGEDNTKDFNDIKEHIGLVLDDCCFNETLTVKNIGIMMKNIYKTWNENKFNGFLNHFSLPHNKTIKEFSKGMKMKLSIAVALSHDSRLLILDEATSGLDPVVRNEILDILKDFCYDEENAVLISSHIFSDIEKISDYITFIHNGKILFSLPKDELLESYGVLKCSHKDLELVDKSKIVGVRKNTFGVEALVKRSPDLKGIIEKATIEDIMLYYIKEDTTL